MASSFQSMQINKLFLLIQSYVPIIYEIFYTLRGADTKIYHPSCVLLCFGLFTAFAFCLTDVIAHFGISKALFLIYGM